MQKKASNHQDDNLQIQQQKVAKSEVQIQNKDENLEKGKIRRSSSKKKKVFIKDLTLRSQGLRLSFYLSLTMKRKRKASHRFRKRITTNRSGSTQTLRSTGLWTNT